MDYESVFETDETRPVAAWCDASFVYITLADGRQIRTPMAWYPFLDEASSKDRAEVELMLDGVWWPIMDEGISVKGALLGWKAPGAQKPQWAA